MYVDGEGEGWRNSESAVELDPVNYDKFLEILRSVRVYDREGIAHILQHEYERLKLRSAEGESESGLILVMCI